MCASYFSVPRIPPNNVPDLDVGECGRASVTFHLYCKSKYTMKRMLELQAIRGFLEYSKEINSQNIVDFAPSQVRGRDDRVADAVSRIRLQHTLPHHLAVLVRVFTFH